MDENEESKQLGMFSFCARLGRGGSKNEKTTISVKDTYADEEMCTKRSTIQNVKEVLAQKNSIIDICALWRCSDAGV